MTIEFDWVSRAKKNTKQDLLIGFTNEERYKITNFLCANWMLI